MLLWPIKAWLEIILYDLRPFGMEGIYCFDLIKAEKLIWHPVVKETNSHTKENSCDGIIQTIQVTLERKKAFSSKHLYSTHFTTVEIKIIALYAYWKAVFNLEKAKCHIFFRLPILRWGCAHKHTYHWLPISKNYKYNQTDVQRRRKKKSLIDRTMINTLRHIPYTYWTSARYVRFPNAFLQLRINLTSSTAMSETNFIFLGDIKSSIYSLPASQISHKLSFSSTQ